MIDYRCEKCKNIFNITERDVIISKDSIMCVNCYMKQFAPFKEWIKDDDENENKNK